MFYCNLGRNLEHGHALEVAGKLKSDGVWFVLALLARDNRDPTKLLTGVQISVNVHRKVMGFKSASNQWQDEIHKEIYTDLRIIPFKFNIVMGDDHCYVSLNNMAYGKIIYTIPVNRLCSIEITGDLEYLKQVDHRKYFPYPWPPLQLSDDSFDFSNDQPASFQAGHVMVLNTMLLGNPKGRFHIIFRNSRDSNREELNICVCFKTKKIIRNAKTTKCVDRQNKIEYFVYDSGESDGNFPFTDFHLPFRLAIAFTETKFLIGKDGRFLYTFPYRSPYALHELVGTKIKGTDGVNVRVTSINHVQMNDLQCTNFEHYSRI